MSTLILGSKPNPQITVKNYKNIIYINGSIENDLNLKGSKIYHILSSMILFENTELAVLARNRLKNKTVDYIIMLDIYNFPIEQYKKRLDDLNYIYQYFEFYSIKDFEKCFSPFNDIQYWKMFLLKLFDKEYSFKEKIETLKYYLRGRKHLSSGFSAIMYAINNFNFPIYVAGFSRKKGGYKYKRNNVRRGHELQDFIFFSLLQQSNFKEKLIFLDYNDEY
ncbi:hypothetical protein DEFDS_0380 [Deferribacter desulfuricans SSM1]|uniref:Uncharacterized protein n=1 Tax=Deferribacter desulfuricans (strain DSM 14783 / JCM 11476 / NBRC 101012 / SSM1) TaxID=639282 RepID=D3PBA1_DEFDS|nr:hypothetical protein [Deferribacter desulfuricans]BAI79874.1 hypothetical protein DEFDS_0380 [Deferribacter desulfuricans SSM1]